ncbi:hypothetical protein Pcinc_029879 [Petrolisthes cinctipes]|uniref:Uncharacterized protein n=1 Tax=Petrolisthes cinctipes TaxID=88211 RepID=A0AAE1F029_PETCI|nr:hypothetical protein Pcinc_029879 [Petrolisthes cinctipes]
MGPLVYLVSRGHYHALASAATHLATISPPSLQEYTAHRGGNLIEMAPRNQGVYRLNNEVEEDSITLRASNHTAYGRSNQGEEDWNESRTADQICFHRPNNQEGQDSIAPRATAPPPRSQTLGHQTNNTSWENRSKCHVPLPFLPLTALYSGTLTAYMTKPSYENPIDSLQHLLEAHKEGFVPGVQQGTSNMRLLKDAKQGIFKALWELTDPTRSFPSGGHVAMDMVLSSDIVYMSSSLNSEVRATQRGRHRFHLARDTFLPQGYGIACRSGTPFLPVFDAL